MASREQAPIERTIDSVVSCCNCGTKGIGNCDCYEKCACGWNYDKGKACRNPIHERAGRVREAGE